MKNLFVPITIVVSILTGIAYGLYPVMVKLQVLVQILGHI